MLPSLARLYNDDTMKNDLPVEIDRLLAVVGEKLESGANVATDLAALILALSSLPATTVSRAASRIAINTALFSGHEEASWYKKLLRKPLTGKEQLLGLPDLKYLYLFHFDGRLREISLQRIVGALPSPFWFAAVCLRLNDWAEPVRRAAFACAERCFPATAPSVIAEGAVSLTLNQSTWARWGYERAAVDSAMNQPEVIEHIANIICETPTGSLSKVLRLVMKNAAVDMHLARLAVSAKQPAVRAISIQTIVAMKASWPAGWEWKWIDKSMGQRVKVPCFDARDLSIDFDRVDLIRTAASDKAAIVRRALLDALIRRDPTADETVQLGSQLREDSNFSVRERAAFIVSRMGRSIELNRP